MMEQLKNKSESLLPYVVRIKDKNSERIKGTGFLLEGGFLLTAYHVIKKVEPIFEAWDKHKNEFTQDVQVSLAFQDEARDLAIFRLKDSSSYKQRFFHLVHERKTEQGREVAAYGFPHDKGFRFNGARIDAPFDSKHPSGFPAITLNTPEQIDSGFSGGPIYDLSIGAVVGLLTDRASHTAFGIPASAIIDTLRAECRANASKC